MARPRKPTLLKILEGNRGKRPLDLDAEPQPAKGIPATPKQLSPWAKKLWADVTEELDRLGLLTCVDGTSLEAAVRGADQGRWADVQVQRIKKLIAKGEAEQKDYYQLSILNSVSKKGWQQWKTFATEFGLSGPGSRSKIQLPEAARKVDPIEAKLCG